MFVCFHFKPISASLKKLANWTFQREDRGFWEQRSILFQRSPMALLHAKRMMSIWSLDWQSSAFPQTDNCFAWKLTEKSPLKFLVFECYGIVFHLFFFFQNLQIGSLLTLSLPAVNFEDRWWPLQTIWIQMKPHKMWGFIWDPNCLTFRLYISKITRWKQWIFWKFWKKQIFEKITQHAKS